MTKGLESKAMLATVEEELDRLRKVRSLLAGGERGRAGRPGGAKRNLSVEARQRIIDAQKRRWAAHKANA